MGLFEKLKEKAVNNRQRIVLPESTEPRTLAAADRIIADGVAEVILIGSPDDILAAAKQQELKNIEKATIYNPADADVLEPMAQLYYDLRKSKGISIEDARKTAKNPLYFGCLLIKSGKADGQVAGAMNTTGNVLRAAFQTIKTMPGISVVSGAFLMLLPEDSPYGTDGLMVFADCAVLPDPTAEELAQIAVSTERTARDIAGIEPRIAMLSFSTKGSAKHDRVTKVTDALAIVKEKYPNSTSMANCRPTPHWFRRLATARLRVALLPERQMCLCSHRSKWEILHINLFSALPEFRLLVLFCKVWQHRSMICRVDVTPTIFTKQ